MRAGKFGDAMPENAPVFLHGLQISERQILNPLRIKVHFIAILGGETVEQFGDGAFGAMLAIDERRDDGDTHVTQLAENTRKNSAGKSQFLQTLVDCIRSASKLFVRSP
jgi:hypothetical protein